jgi:acyl-coenzyme A synthetase/AMP-(fatty) acid ligase
VIYTSGSTGRPKGVEVSHRGVVNLLRSVGEAVGMDASAVVLALTSLSFDIAGLELFMPLLFGGRVEIGERELGGNGRLLAERLRGCGATLLQATPSSWGLLVGSGWPGVEGLRGLCGGEALPGALAGEIAARCAAAWNVYGPTETTIWSTLCRLAPGGGRVSIGAPVANTDVYVLDDGMRVAPIGVCGELYIGGMGVARGYRGRPELTAERFVPHPYGRRGGERLYATGDLARRLADGRLEYLGRGDQQVKVRGVRIELGEVEAALAAHPQVSEAVAAVRAGAGGEAQLVAYFVASEGAPSASELRRHLGRSLPEAMLPQAYVELAALPLTPNRKVDRRALPEPEGSRPRLDTAYVAPQGAAERRIAALWCQVLGVDRVGVDDNFFDLGGHSLLLVQVHERLTASFPELPLIELFMHPTVAALARRLAGGAELHQQLAQAQAAHEATQVQQRLAGQERLRRRREAGQPAAAGGGA